MKIAAVLDWGNGTGADSLLQRGSLKSIRTPAFIGMALLALVAFADFHARGSSRMLMTFYTVADGRNIIEERTINYAEAQNTDAKLRLYIEEILLGPLSHGAAGFFPEAVLHSCVASGEIAYIGLSSSAVWAGTQNAEGSLTVDTERAIGAFRDDIKRNFRSLKDVVIFIGGRET
jgi:hypothetical protein